MYKETSETINNSPLTSKQRPSRQSNKAKNVFVNGSYINLQITLAETRISSKRESSRCSGSIACGWLALKVTSSIEHNHKEQQLVSRHVFQDNWDNFRLLVALLECISVVGVIHCILVLRFNFVMQCLPLFLAEKSFIIWTEEISLSMFDWLNCLFFYLHG